MLEIMRQFLIPIVLLWIDYKIERKFKIFKIDFLNNIKNLLLGKQYNISKQIKYAIKSEKRKMENELIKTNDKTKTMEIENNHVSTAVEKIGKVYEEGNYTISEIGYRLNILNSDANYFMCVFTGIIGAFLYEISSSYFTQVWNTSEKFKFKNLFVNGLAIGILYIICFAIFIVFFSISLFYFRRVLVISLNRDPIFDEVEKHIIKKTLEDNYKINI